MDAPVVLITGAARRVGAALARRFHDAGARIVVHYRQSATDAAALAEELNGKRRESAVTIAADLTARGAPEALVAHSAAQWGRLDGLINNASSFTPSPLGSIDESQWDDLVGSNFKAPLFLAQAAAPHLKRVGGAIINITDIHAERPLAGYAVYCAAKAGLLGLTRALAIDLAPDVRVNAVAPGPIAWPDNTTDFPPDARNAIVQHTLLKRTGTPDDIARAAAFLFFDAPYVTGQVINVDGGRTAHL